VCEVRFPTPADGHVNTPVTAAEARCRNARVPPAPPIESLERLGNAFAALEAPTERKRMLVIINPYATTVSDRLRTLVVYALQGRYEVDATDTEGRGHATMLCRQAAQEGYDVVVAFGGDGTVSEAANGLAGSDTPLTCLPGGATNVFHRTLGIPPDIVDATEHLLRLADDWRPRRIDLARVNGRGFTFAAGYGLDASVVRRVDRNPSVKARLRQWYYAYAAVSSFLREYVVHPPAIEVAARGRTVRGITAIVQNGDPFTYFRQRPLHLAEKIAVDSGTISVAVLERASPIDVPTVLVRLLSSRLRVADHRRVTIFDELTSATMRSADGRPIPLEVDGDYIGDTVEAVFSVDPGALWVVA
jgi:diacylglycerol kinase family enzyme